MKRRTFAATLAIGMVGMVFPVQAAAGPSDTAPARGQAAEAKIVPLQAVEQITRSADGKQLTRELNRLYRDDQGRTRHESGSMVTITDPVAGTTVRLDTKAGTYSTRSASAPRPDEAPAASGPEVKQLPGPTARSLGTATMAGVAVEGIGHTVTFPRNNGKAITKEYTNWLSRDLKLAVQTRIADESGAEYVRTYTDIRAGVALPADLFTVPAGYRVADPVAPSALPCPLTVAPDPLLLDSFPWFLGAGVQGGYTDHPNYGCAITYTEATVTWPLWATPWASGTDYFEWLFYDTGLPVPWLPWLAYGLSCYNATNAEFGSSACGEVLLFIWP